MKIRRLFSVFVFLGILFFANSFANAAVQVQSSANTPVMGDYIVSPGKVELVLEPGQSVTRNIVIVNRLGSEKNFQLGLEDIKGTIDPNNLVQFMGPEKGPYSLKDFIRPEETSFTLRQGDSITIPVTISIPTSIPPGGLYGSVIVSVQGNAGNGAADASTANGKINVKTRIAVLYFVRIKGNASESGFLKNFTTDHGLNTNGPVQISYAYQNDGNVYENPYGYIEIKNLFGAVVDKFAVEPYYVLPDSVRTNKISWDHGLMFGRYKATLFLNRGYGNQIDQKSVYFWALPLVIIVPVLLGLVLLAVFCVWIIKNYRRKKQL